MWNPFKKKKSPEAATSHTAVGQKNTVDELANALQREGRVQDLELELSRLDRSTLSPAELESWWHLFGIAAFREERHAEALERFLEGYRLFPASGHIRFSLGQQYINTGEIDKGFLLFSDCKWPEVPRDYIFAQARYAYLWNRYDDGVTFIKPFFDAYRKVKILDSHFLYVRGLPFFETWWGYMTSFAILSGSFSDIESMTRFVVENCHDYAFDLLQAELDAYRDDRPDLLLEQLVQQLERIPAGHCPTGYIEMKIAIIKSQRSRTVEAAEEILKSVTLSENDYPWLEDMRTLALAEAAYRLNAPVIEKNCIESFLQRQPMLFEPDTALNFHLLRYQERVKDFRARH